MNVRLLIPLLFLCFQPMLHAQDAAREKKILQKKLQEPPVLVWKALKLVLRAGSAVTAEATESVFKLPSGTNDTTYSLRSAVLDLLVRMRKDSLGDLNRPSWTPDAVLRFCEANKSAISAAEEDKFPLAFRKLLPATDFDSLRFAFDRLGVGPSADAEHFLWALGATHLARVPDLIALYELSEIRWNKPDPSELRFQSSLLYAHFLARNGLPFLALEKLQQLETEQNTRPYSIPASIPTVKHKSVQTQRQIMLKLLRLQIYRNRTSGVDPEIRNTYAQQCLKALGNATRWQSAVRIAVASAQIEAGALKKAQKTLAAIKPSGKGPDPDALLAQQCLKLFKEKKDAEAVKMLHEAARYHYESMKMWSVWEGSDFDADGFWKTKWIKGSNYPLYRLYHTLFAIRWH
jgi:hypothetical protein